MLGLPLAVAEGDRYELDAGDGVPGAFRIAVGPNLPGVWRFEAVWQGRGIAGLWLEDSTGATVSRQVGASPLVLEILFDEAAVRNRHRFLLRYSTTTSRGILDGHITVTAPVDRSAEPPPEPPPNARELLGPGACLTPGFGHDAAGAALERFAVALEGCSPASLTWARRWSGTLKQLLLEERAGRARRYAIDELWEQLSVDPSPDQSLGRAYRRLLAAMEDLARREDQGRGGRDLTARREAIGDLLGCLGGAPSAANEGS